MSDDRRDGWALVTGASGRGGAAISRALHARGLDVVLHHTAHSTADAVALAAELDAVRPGSARPWAGDFLAADFAVPAWVVELGVAVVVCNASAYVPSTLADARRRHVDWAVHVDAHATILAALGPRDGATGALRSVVAISDIAVDAAPTGHVGYTIAKGALQTLALTLANEWAPQVRCNVVQPGSLPFPPDWRDDERTRKVLASIPLGRLGTFEELASVVTFLALDASYVTGQVLAVDGGRSRQAH